MQLQFFSPDFSDWQLPASNSDAWHFQQTKHRQQCHWVTFWGKQRNSATHLTGQANAANNRAFAVCDRPAGAQISLQIGQISSQRQYRFNINSEIGSICAREIRPDPKSAYIFTPMHSVRRIWWWRIDSEFREEIWFRYNACQNAYFRAYNEGC